MIALTTCRKTVRAATEPLTILHPLTLDDCRRAVRRHRRAVGQRQVDAARAHRRARRADVGPVLIDGVDITTLDEDALARLRGEKIGFVFQFFHLIPSLTALENVPVPMEIAGPARRGRARAGAARRGRAAPAARITIRRSSRAASSSASRSRARWPTIRRSCWPTSRRATSTAPTAATSWICCCSVAAHAEATLVLVTHDASWPPWPTRGSSCATADRWTRPR